MPEPSTPWHSDESFWKIYAPLMFNTARWELAEVEADRIIDILHLKEGDALLDTCCGVGRHSVALAGRGLNVTGVDCTRAYLDAAMSTAEAEGLNISFIHQDLRTFQSPPRFDAAINMFTSFGYFENDTENLLCLKNIYTSLKPGGRVLLDLLGKEILARDFKESEWFEEEGMLILQEHRVINNWTRLENRWLLIKDGRRYDYTFSHSVYSAKEIKELVGKAGFKSCEIYGSLQETPYDSKAVRLIAVGKK